MADATTPQSTPGTDAAVKLAQAHEDKAVAKATADDVVAADPNAQHGVLYSFKSPKVWASAAAGAAIGAPFGGPIGAAAGALVGAAVQRHNMAGGPIGKAYDAIAGRIAKWRGK